MCGDVKPTSLDAELEVNTFTFIAASGEEQPRARRSRLRLIEAALDLFVREGYEQATLQRIAEAANTSVGLAYRYFPAKEQFALALYDRLANELEAWSADLPAGTVAERFRAVMLHKLRWWTPTPSSTPASRPRAARRPMTPRPVRRTPIGCTAGTESASTTSRTGAHRLRSRVGFPSLPVGRSAPARDRIRVTACSKRCRRLS
jgi:AcrR family transcriptional regulator